MPLVLADRVRETTTVSGTNDAVLLGAVTGFQSFAVVGNTNTCYYTIADNAGNWEVGLGTYSTTGPTLARTTVLSSSNSGSKVSFPAGTKDIFVTYPSEKSVNLDESGYIDAGGSPNVSLNGNLTFIGTTRRITGDFTNATPANRVAFQTSTANSNTAILTIPNGTATFSGFQFLNNPDANNASFLQVGSSSTLASIVSSIFGSGTYLPIAIFTGNAERLRIDTSGNVGIGASSTSAFFNGTSTAAKVFISYSSTNTTVDDPTPNLALHNPSTTTNNYSSLYFSTVNSSATLVGTSAILGIHGARDTAWGSGALAFLTTASGADGPTERMRIDSSGNVGIGTTDIYSRVNIQGSNIAGATTGEANGVGALRIIGSPSALSDVNSGIEFKLAGDTNGYGSKIVAISSGGSNIVFANRQATATWSEQMRITAAGNVGIGTSSPSTKLGIVVSPAAGGSSGISVGDGTRSLLMQITGSTYSYNGVGASENLIYAGGNPLSFLADGQPIKFCAGSAERMRIDSSGNVGIGTSSPTKRLSVVNAVDTTTVGNNSVMTIQGGAGGTVNSVAEIGFAFQAFSGTNPLCALGYQLTSNAGSGSGALTFSTRSVTTDTAPSERMRIDSSGNLLVGTTTANGRISSTAKSGFFPGTTAGTWADAAALTVSGSFGGGISLIDGTAGYNFYCADSGNDFYIQGATSTGGTVTGGVFLDNRATSWSSASDENVKDIIEPITNAVEKISTLRTVIGKYKDEEEGKRHPFLIAQDVQAVLPEAVSVMHKGSDNECLALSYTDVIPLLVASIQELKAELDSVKAELQTLKGK
jgi:hypothetical protein